MFSFQGIRLRYKLKVLSDLSEPVFFSLGMYGDMHM